MRYAPVSVVAVAVLLFITFTFVTEQTAQSKSEICIVLGRSIATRPEMVEAMK